MGIELTQKAKDLLAKRGFDPVLGARPLRRTIQREIEDQLSEKILFGEIGAGEIITVDVEGWDGESKDNSSATFTFTPRPRPLPEDTFDKELEETAVREADEELATEIDEGSHGPNSDGPDTVTPDVLDESGSDSAEESHNNDGDDGNPPPAGAGAGQPL